MRGTCKVQGQLQSSLRVGGTSDWHHAALRLLLGPNAAAFQQNASNATPVQRDIVTDALENTIQQVMRRNKCVTTTKAYLILMLLKPAMTSLWETTRQALPDDLPQDHLLAVVVPPLALAALLILPLLVALAPPLAPAAPLVLPLLAALVPPLARAALVPSLLLPLPAALVPSFLAAFGGCFVECFGAASAGCFGTSSRATSAEHVCTSFGASSASCFGTSSRAAIRWLVCWQLGGRLGHPFNTLLVIHTCVYTGGGKKRP